MNLLPASVGASWPRRDKAASKSSLAYETSRRANPSQAVNGAGATVVGSALPRNTIAIREICSIEGDFSMQKTKWIPGGICTFALLLSLAVIRANAQNAPNFVGTWDLTMAAPQGGGGNGRGGGNGGAQSLVITQDGDKYKVTHKTPRGDVTSDATVDGSAISWTEERQGRNGNTMQMQFKATVDGDSMTGTMSGGRFSRDFTAKRASS